MIKKLMVGLLLISNVVAFSKNTHRVYYNKIKEMKLDD